MQKLHFGFVPLRKLAEKMHSDFRYGDLEACALYKTAEDILRRVDACVEGRSTLFVARSFVCAVLAIFCAL